MKNNWRPLKILFVGDSPSSKNVDPSVAFVGTASYKRLLRWIGELDLDIENVKLTNSKNIVISLNEYDKILYLGNRSFINTTIYMHNDEDDNKFKTIDHPSPRNRKFNDPNYEEQMLKDLKKWLYE